jgi:hypothetical protein
MESTKREPWRPVHNGLKSQTVNLRTSPDENDILKQAAEKLSQQTGEKENVSKTIIEAVKQFKDQQPYFVDELIYQNNCKIYTEALVYFQKLADQFDTLGIGHVTSDFMRKISNRNFTGIKELVDDHIAENLKSFTNKEIIDDLRLKAEHPYLKFLIHGDLTVIEIDIIRRKHPEIELIADNFTIENGIVSFTDDSKARLKEKSTIRIDTQAKREFQQLTETTLENLQALKVVLNRNGVDSIFGDGNLFSDAGGIILNKKIMKFITK